MIIKKPVDECRSSAEYVAANMPHGGGTVFHLLAWVAEHGEVAMEHIDRAVDTGNVDPCAPADDLIREGMRFYLRHVWLVWSYRSRAPDNMPGAEAWARSMVPRRRLHQEAKP